MTAKASQALVARSTTRTMRVVIGRRSVSCVAEDEVSPWKQRHPANPCQQVEARTRERSRRQLVHRYRRRTDLRVASRSVAVDQLRVGHQVEALQVRWGRVPQMVRHRTVSVLSQMSRANETERLPAGPSYLRVSATEGEPWAVRGNSVIEHALCPGIIRLATGTGRPASPRRPQPAGRPWSPAVTAVTAVIVGS